MQSIFDDIKSVFTSGNMVSKLLLANVIAFLAIYLVKIFTLFTGPEHAQMFQSFVEAMSVHSDMWYNLKHPWVFVTHAFFHLGLFHLLINLLMLYWFGRILGDMAGDDKVLPIYTLGFLAGMIFFLVFTNVAPQFSGYAHGASAGVMAIVVAAGMIAPDYVIHLILIGPVRLKYVVLVVLLFDFIGIANLQNTGGRIGHIGGAFMGFLYIYLLYNGRDLGQLFKIEKASSRPKKVKAKVIPIGRTTGEKTDTSIDQILDKINKDGIQSLSEEERKILDDASKKSE